MSNDNDIISDQEIERITGYEKPSMQCKALADAGVWFLTRKDGRPSTSWAHFNNPLKHRQATPTATEPDWGAMD
jgi:hypothetical protein